MIGVLVSGEGTNLQALIDARTADHGRRIEPSRRAALVARPVGRDPDRDVQPRLPRRPDERDLVLASWLEEHGVELVVLAGYMHLLTPAFLRPFPGRGS